ncbi:hypothetical protein [Bradyrhizobium sp. STM 3557]|uniref:hypothetical protein n=1 Tax=Bradyrhizobium sp. STM 3557 TaxID=578920 RepID=UPI003890F408
MADVASFGDIVNSLLALRQDYHEKLRSIPQYEAYLLVESSTEKAAGALHASAGSPASIAAEVIDSLQFARNRFEQHLGSLPEYRALLAIDRLIDEISVDLDVTKPEPASAAKLPEPVFDAAPSPLSESIEPVAAEPEAAAAVHEDVEANAPLQPARAMNIDLDDVQPVNDDSVPVPTPRRESSIEGGEDEDLLEIVYRDVTKAAAETADVEHADDVTEPSPALPPQPKVFDGDTDEAAA